MSFEFFMIGPVVSNIKEARDQERDQELKAIDQEIIH